MFEQDLLKFLLNENNFFDISNTEFIFYINNENDIKKIEFATS